MAGKAADDLFARVGRLESAMLDVRADVAEIKATLPHLATRADVASLETRMEARFGSMETHLMRWSIGTAIGLAGTLSAVMVAVVRFVHP
jgi:hypothetical protein